MERAPAAIQIFFWPSVSALVSLYNGFLPFPHGCHGTGPGRNSRSTRDHSTLTSTSIVGPGISTLEHVLYINGLFLSCNSYCTIHITLCRYAGKISFSVVIPPQSYGLDAGKGYSGFQRHCLPDFQSPSTYGTLLRWEPDYYFSARREVVRRGTRLWWILYF